MTSGEWLIPIATLLFGQLSLMGVEWVRHQSTRRQQRNDARDDSQRQTLLKLQDTLDELALDAATVFALRERSFPIPGRRKDIRYDNAHAQAAIRAHIRMTTLAERVTDDQVRDLVRQLDAALREAIANENNENTAEAIERFRSLRRQTNERIGTLLRSL